MLPEVDMNQFAAFAGTHNHIL